MQQMLIWQEPLTDEVLMRKELLDLKDKQNNLRRGLFQRFDQLQKEVVALKEEVMVLRKERIN